MEKRLRYFWRPTLGYSWRVDETYIKTKDQWKYLYRPLDRQGNTIDLYISSSRNTHAAKRFLGKTLRRFKDWQKPQAINTDKACTYAVAIKELKEEGICPPEIRHRQVKYTMHLYTPSSHMSFLLIM